MKTLFLALLLLASPALAQNPQCPDRPTGDSTNACANTRFVVSNAGSGAANVKLSPYNAKGNGVKGTDGAITGSTTTFTSASASFTTDDVGKMIVIQGAGPIGVIGAPRSPHFTTISAVNSPTSVALAVPATFTVSSATYQYCTDDTSGIQAAINSGFGSVYFPKGRYCIGPAGLTGTSNKFWVGDGTGTSIITAGAKPTTNFIIFNTKTNVRIRELTFDAFELLYDFNSGTFPRILPIIYYVAGSDLKIQNSEFLGWDTDGILTNTAFNITISNNLFTRTTQSSGHLTGGTTGADGAITSGTNVFNSASAAFVVGDVGKMMIIEGAGTGGITLVGSIIARNSATQVALSNKAGTTVSGARYQYAPPGSQVSVTGIEMAGTGTPDSNNLRDFSINANIVTNGSIGISGHDGSITNNSISGHSFGAGIHTQGLTSNFNITITGNQVTRGFVMQDTAGAYPGGIENWAAGSTVSANSLSYNTGPGISIGGKTVVAGNAVYNNGQGNNIAITAAGFGGIAAFWQDATFNSNGSIISGNTSYDNQGSKTQEYGYTENSNLGVGCPGACQGNDISLIGNDFSNNLTAAMLLQPIARPSNMASTIAIGAGGFTGGTFNSNAITAANPLTLANFGTGGFSLQLRPNTTMTANRILDLNMDSNRILSMGADILIGSGAQLATAGSNPITLNSTAGSVTAQFFSGSHVVAGLDVAQTWSANQTFNSGNFKLAGSGSGAITIQPIAAAGTNTLTLAVSIASQVTFNGDVTFSGGFATTFTTTGATNVTLPTSGTLVNLSSSQTFTGNINFQQASTWGTGTGQRLNVINGGNTGTTDGACIYFQNNTVLQHAIGNRSCIFGGGYSSDGVIYSSGLLSIYVAGTELDRFHASGGLSIGTLSDPGAGMLYTNSATFMHRTKTSWTNGAAAGAGTITNAPVAGNPTKWIPVDDNGTTRYVPAW